MRWWNGQPVLKKYFFLLLLFYSTFSFPPLLLLKVFLVFSLSLSFYLWLKSGECLWHRSPWLSVGWSLIFDLRSGLRGDATFSLPLNHEQKEPFFKKRERERECLSFMYNAERDLYETKRMDDEEEEKHEDEVCKCSDLRANIGDIFWPLQIFFLSFFLSSGHKKMA